MNAPDGHERRAGILGKFVERLHNPAQLRLFVMLAVLGIGYAGVAMPLMNRINDADRILAECKKRLTLADEIDRMRKQYHRVESRLAAQSDTNEWLQYVLSGIRKSPLKLNSFTPGAPQAIGPFQIVSLNVKLSGDYADVDRFLYWLESNERLFRVDNLKIVTAATPEGMEIRLDMTVVGVIG